MPMTAGLTHQAAAIRRRLIREAMSKPHASRSKVAARFGVTPETVRAAMVEDGNGHIALEKWFHVKWNTPVLKLAEQQQVTHQYLYWVIHRMINEGYLKKTGRGKYRLTLKGQKYGRQKRKSRQA